MTHDAALPAGFEPTRSTVERSGVLYEVARWTPRELQSLALHLTTAGGAALAGIASRELFDAWGDTVDAFRDPQSAERQSLDPSLTRLCRLSPPGLDAGLEAVLGGVSRDAAAPLSNEAEAWRHQSGDRGLIVVSLAANLPGLAVQPLLPALLLGHPVVVKSPSSEPLFAPAFVRALTRRLPALASALAAITWKGGDQSLEAPLLTAASRILAYGEAESIADLRSRAPGKVFAYGPKTSLAVVDGSTAPESVAPGLARDIALFDQRGCLSIQAIYTDGNARDLATRLAAELQDLADKWPPGPLDPVAAAGVQQVRTEAALRGLFCAATPLGAGTVVIEPEPHFRPSPGLRTVRVQPLQSLERLPEILVEWSGRLQGAALAGDQARALQPALEALGLSRFAAPGQLQTPDASWHNGGVHPFAALTDGAAEST